MSKIEKQKKDKPKRRGAHGRYEDWITPDGLTAIEGWAREGLTDKNIGQKMGISERTFTSWKARFPAIVAALKKGKAPVDFKVENTLLKSALGFVQVVKEPVKLKTKRNKPGVGTVEEERIEYVEREIYIKPDVTAQIFWLKNRKPDKWRDKHEVASTADGQLAALIDGLKEPVEYDIHSETESGDGSLAEE